MDRQQLRQHTRRTNRLLLPIGLIVCGQLWLLFTAIRAWQFGQTGVLPITFWCSVVAFVVCLTLGARRGAPEANPDHDKRP